MNNQNWRLLQIFADGAAGGAGGGEGGQASGDNAVDAGQQRLLELGVPRDRLPKAKAKASAPPPVTRQGSSGTPTPTENPGSEQGKESADKGQEAGTPSVTGASAGDSSPPGGAESSLDWDAIVQNPDFNNRLQYMMRQRLGEEGSAKEKLAALGPVLQKLASAQGVELDTSDMMKLNPEELQLQLSHGRDYIRQVAADMGVDESTAADVVKNQDMVKLLQNRERERQLREAFNQHVSGLRAQAEMLKGELPGLDFDREMQNPRFRKMVGPETRMSVKEAYWALHADELMQQKTAAAAQQSREQLSAAVQANQQRPRENGTGGPAAPVPHFDYKSMSPREREAFKARIQQAAYRGEKIYPGME